MLSNSLGLIQNRDIKFDDQLANGSSVDIRNI